MSKIKGIYAASMSILNHDLSLNTEKTIKHAELQYLVAQAKLNLYQFQIKLIYSINCRQVNIKKNI